MASPLLCARVAVALSAQEALRLVAGEAAAGGSREEGDVEHFKVDGTTLLSWTIQVQAHDEREAREEAQNIAGWIDLPSSLATFHRTEHRIAVVRLPDPENE